MVPKLWWLVKRLPRSWRIGLLEALAWPEFEVKRLWLASDANGPRVDRIDIDEGERRNRDGLAWYLAQDDEEMLRQNLANSAGFVGTNRASNFYGQ